MTATKFAQRGCPFNRDVASAGEGYRSGRITKFLFVATDPPGQIATLRVVAAALTLVLDMETTLGADEFRHGFYVEKLVARLTPGESSHSSRADFDSGPFLEFSAGAFEFFGDKLSCPCQRRLQPESFTRGCITRPVPTSELSLGKLPHYGDFCGAR